MHTFPDPLSSVEPSSNYLPFNSEFIDANAAPVDRHGARIATTGPSDTYNYWTGDHYHDEAGIGGEINGGGIYQAATVPDADKPFEPEAPTLVDRSRDKLEAEGVNVESKVPYGLVFETKQEREGASVDPNYWQANDAANAAIQSDDVDDEATLNAAGVVTDRLPGLGPKSLYKKALPTPFYEKEPTNEESNADLEAGHRYISPVGHHMQDDLGIALAKPNILEYGAPGTHSPHMSFDQEHAPMIDGLGDQMETAGEAELHKPLNTDIDDKNFMAGSEKLEAAGVNVWKLPLHQYIPGDFFGRETKAMRQEDGSKLASVGVAVEHGPFLDTAPKVGQ